MSGELLIPVFGTKFAKGWPKHEHGDPAAYMPIGRAMSVRHKTDAHFAAYSLPSEKRRLADDAIFDRLPDGFAMCLLAVDVDGPDHAVTDEWWRGERIKIDHLIAAHPGAFVFRTRGGYRLIYLLARPVVLKSVHDKERWKRRYVAWSAYLKREFEIAGDEHCKDWARLYRLPFVIRDGKAQEFETIGDATAIGMWDVEVDDSPQETIRTTATGAADHVGTLSPGERHGALLGLAGAMRAKGADEATIVAALESFNAAHCSPPKPTAELYEIARFVWSKPAGATHSDRDPPQRQTRDLDPDLETEPMPEPPDSDPDDNAEPADSETAAEIPPDEHPNNPAGEPFARDKNGKIVQTSSKNIKLALRKLGVTVRYDMFADQELIDGLPGFGPYLDDAAVTRMRVLIHERFEGFRPDKDWFYDVVSDCAQEGRFHPVRDYLDSLEWDRVPRLDGWLARYGCADDTDYTRAVGTLVLIAAVRRARKPGCKFDEMLILESPEQGKFKSTALRVLAVHEDWFSDDLPLTGDTKRAMEQTAGKWIVEAGELKGMSKDDIRALKGYVSRQVDEARMSYGRKRKRQPRQFVIIGTTNETADYLKDTTGNRRFWPVRIRQFSIDLLRKDRDQLWAEAAHREALGESIRLDPSLYQVAAAEQEDRRLEDSIEVVCTRHFGDITGKIETEEAWAVLGISNRPLTTDETTRFGVAMRKLGWEKTRLRTDGGRGYFYVRGGKSERDRDLGVIGFGRGAEVVSKEEADEHRAEQDSSPRPPRPGRPRGSQEYHPNHPYMD